MKTIHLTEEESNFISEALGIFRKLSEEQQLEIIEQLNMTLRLSRGLC